jgi:hypothetical protein
LVVGFDDHFLIIHRDRYLIIIPSAGKNLALTWVRERRTALALDPDAFSARPWERADFCPKPELG